jgi:glutaconate CoA-transferase subunit A
VAEIVSLAAAIEAAIHDGDTVAMEGFTHLIPHAAGREVMRQRRRGLTLVRMTPDIVYDQMIGAGCARKLVFSWGGNPGVGSLHRFRDAYENGWPGPLEIEEHSHAGMANRYVAGASGLPFAVLRGYRGTGLATVTPNVTTITCPFTGEELTAVAALRPGAVVLPAWTVTYVAAAPGGAHPSYALDYSVRDNDFYVAWDAISRDREAFTRWLDAEVYAGAAQ